MKEKITIFGKNITDQDKTKVRDFLQSKKDMNRQKIEDEYEKTDEEIKFIQVLSGYISQELEKLGIQEVPEIKPDEFHFLPQDMFKKKYRKETNGNGVYDAHEQVVYISRDRMKNRLYKFQTMMHDAVHLVAFKKMHKEESGGIIVYRSGYVSRNVNLLEDQDILRHEHFRGLDEAIVDKFTFDLVNNNWENLKEEFNISNDEVDRSKVYYHEPFIAILDEIIKRLAEHKGEKEDKIWENFKRGLFTGEMLHLRDVEKTFGPGSLRVLGALNSKNTRQRMFHSTEVKRIKDFFQAKSQEERDELAAQILNKQELKKYQNRQI